MARRGRRIAFTLIELLVTVAIIGLLISILLPALSAARRSARTTVCGSNLREIGRGWMIYAGDNQGVIVPGRPGKFADPSDNVYWVGNGYQFRPRWYVTMGAAVGFHAFNEPSPDPALDNTKLIDGSKVFLCPEVGERANNRNSAYGYNFQFLGNARFMGGTAGRYIRFPVKLERILGAQTVMAADALGTAAGKPATDRTDYRLDGASDLTALGNHAWSLDPPRLTAAGDFCDDNNRQPEHRSAPERRHVEKFNVLWCDGRVTLTTYRGLDYIENPDGSIAATDPNATNRHFSGTARDDDPPPVQ